MNGAGVIFKSLAPEPAVSTALAADVSVTAGESVRRESNCLAPTLAMGGYGWVWAAVRRGVVLI